MKGEKANTSMGEFPSGQFPLGQFLWRPSSGFMNERLVHQRPYAVLLEKLKACGLRPTRQRLALARLLAEAGHCHMTAEELHRRALVHGVRVSLATVYNTLHQFTEAGMLREIVVDSTRSYFDTNVSDHHHFYDEDSAELADIQGEDVVISRLPQPPEGQRIARVDVVVRVKAGN